jgi:hypothetical protein
MKLLTKVEASAAILSFAMIFVSALVGRGSTFAKLAILFFFFIFGFACIGLMIHVFIVLQSRIGNAATPMVRLLSDHETGITFAFWGFLGLGTLIALPFALKDLVGFEIPIGRSNGVLMADIGMTIDEVKRRSTLKFKEPRLMRDGSHMGVENTVFDFQIGDSAMRFPQSRYYWMETPKGDTHITVLNIGITPRKMPKPELEGFRHKLQEQLFADGWMPGHILAKNEETIRMWSGSRTVGDGRYWAKRNTLLIFETNRMDEEKRGEAPGSGEYILYIELEPKSKKPELVYERSAWPN